MALFRIHDGFKAPRRQESSPASLGRAPSAVFSAELLDMKVEDQCLRDLVQSVAIKKWKEIGRHLGIDEFIIVRIDENDKDDVSERFYQMGLEWKKRVKVATYGDLIEALDSCGFDHVVNEVVAKYVSSL